MTKRKAAALAAGISPDNGSIRDTSSTPDASTPHANSSIGVPTPLHDVSLQGDWQEDRIVTLPASEPLVHDAEQHNALWEPLNRMFNIEYDEFLYGLTPGAEYGQAQINDLASIDFASIACELEPGYLEEYFGVEESQTIRPGEYLWDTVGDN